jgi:hypothetical protein
MAYSPVRMTLSRSHASDDHHNETAGDDPLRARNKHCSVQRARMKHSPLKTLTDTAKKKTTIRQDNARRPSAMRPLRNR